MPRSPSSRAIASTLGVLSCALALASFVVVKVSPFPGIRRRIRAGGDDAPWVPRGGVAGRSVCMRAGRRVSRGCACASPSS
jgi:hypothetical protein